MTVEKLQHLATLQDDMRHVGASIKSMEVIDKEGGDSAGPVIEAITSTEQRDRDGDVIRQSFDLGPYLKNPVIPWAHDYSQPPVGKANDVSVRPEGLFKRIEFTPRDLYPFGHTVGRMYVERFLNAFSIGFLPKDLEPLDDGKGFDIQHSEILESSALLIQSNRGALVQARGAGIDIQPVADAMSKMLDELGDDDPIKRALYERVWKDAAQRRLFSGPSGAGLGERDLWEDGRCVADIGTIEHLATKAGIHCKRNDDECTLEFDEKRASEMARRKEQPAKGDTKDKRNRNKLARELYGRAWKIAKAGRVLSKRNRNKLANAAELIGEVLESAKREDESEDGKGVTLKQASAQCVKQIGDRDAWKVIGTLDLIRQRGELISDLLMRDSFSDAEESEVVEQLRSISADALSAARAIEPPTDMGQAGAGSQDVKDAPQEHTDSKDSPAREQGDKSAGQSAGREVFNIRFPA